MTNHLAHHQMFEETIPALTKQQLIGYTGGTAAIVVAAIEIILSSVGGA
tara:strand:+ start:590 stop:736 length:147 start_codon:yes stop_codon:yes gene_type:complete